MSANNRPEEKASETDLAEAMDDFATLPYFPHESRAAIVALLVRMVPHRRALKWLVGEFMNHIGKWHGPAELRGVLCTRFDPEDGIDQWSSLPGYSAEDGEAKALADHEQLKMQERVNGYIGEEAQEILIAGRKVKTLQ
jgi:hypothetical protein